MKDTDKRLAILDAARRVVAEHGYTRATVEDIAHAAGVAKGTVYLYFKDKPDILFGLVEQMLDQGLVMVREIAGGPDAPTEKLRRIYDGWAEAVRNHGGWAPLFSPDAVRLASVDTERLDNAVRPRMRRILDALVGIVEAGIRSGEFRPVNPHLAAAMFIHDFSVLFIIQRHELPVANPVGEILDAYMRGIAAAPAAEGRAL